MYKLLDYDITEYKQLENTLNELSKQGYNPTSLGKISRFEKNEKHYYFHVDLLIKKPATPKRKALHDFINEYEKQYTDWYYLNKVKGTYKKCCRCGEIKLVQEFDVDKNLKSGIKSACKECRKKDYKKK